MRMLLGSEWVDRPETIDVCDPFDNSVIDTVPSATAEDVETAVGALLNRSGSSARIMKAA